MPIFVWKGKTAGGETTAGELAAENRAQLVQMLRKRRISVVNVREKPKGLALPLLKKRSVSTKEMAVFTRQFATMIDAGLPLVQCLDTISKQAENKYLKEVLSSVMQDVEAGSTLAAAMARHRKVFSNLYTNMVEAGETGGALDDILERLAVHIEKADALRRKVKGAMTYPLVVLGVALSAAVFMLVFIIPTFARMFSDFGAALPLPTRVVLGISYVLRTFWWALGGSIAGTVIMVKRFYKTTAGKFKIDGLLLKSPIFGSLLRKTAVARFTRTLGTLISSGVPILTGLEITAETAGNAVVRKAVLATKAGIKEGDTIAKPLRTTGVFPPMVVQMVAVGEETGSLDEMLAKIADFYESEVDTAVDSLTSILEPAMIVLMGVLVGGMVVAMYLPMFKLVSVIANG
jgi:type IV pilus assembly protein PilC